MKLKVLLAAALLAVSFFSFAEGALSIKQPFGDNMVLQQDTMAVLAGHASAGGKVRIVTSWDGRSYRAVADSTGVWEIRVRTPRASYTSYHIDVKSGRERLVIRDVLVGEVWIASGQSNMEMPIRGFYNCPVRDSYEVITSPADGNRLRMFTVKLNQTFEPVSEVAKTDGWLKPDPETVRYMSAVAYFFAKKLNEVLDVPVGIVAFPRGGARVESWMPRKTVESYGTEDCSEEGVKKLAGHLRPYVMYNGMQQPVKGYTAKGFIWYQGCSNVGTAEIYADRLKEMVRQWREDWGDRTNAMPFYQVEIAPCRQNSEVLRAKSPLLRQAQLESADEIPNGAIVSTDDLVEEYEMYNVHPANKRPVGYRLANLALNRDYGFEKLYCYCPRAEKAYRSEEDPSTIFVKLSHCHTGVDRTREVKGMEVAGEDGVFFPVENIRMRRTLGNVIQISLDEVPYPVTVRYCWDDFRPGNLHSVEGLPIFPFNLSVEEIKN